MERVDEPMLVRKGGSDDNESIPLQGRKLSMGRQASNDVVVQEPGVSRNHAELFDTDGVFYVRDLGSTNGTFVNDEKIPEGDRLLSDGDSVRLGSSTTSFVFHSPIASTMAVSLSELDADLDSTEGGRHGSAKLWARPRPAPTPRPRDLPQPSWRPRCSKAPSS